MRLFKSLSFRRLKVKYVIGLCVLVLLAAGCRPGVAPGSPESVFNHGDGWAAVDQAFAPYGPVVVDCAHRIATRESGHWPYAGLGKYYQGMFQMHPGFQGSIDRAAIELGGGHFNSFFDPYVAALAARYGFEAAGLSFRNNWPTTPSGCP